MPREFFKRMPKCPNGHEQRLGLKCATCGSKIVYRDACEELLRLPDVKPDFGRLRMVSAGFPVIPMGVGNSSLVDVGEATNASASSFTVPRIQGGSWLDYYTKHADELNQWLRLTGFDRSTYRFVAVDTTTPMGVMVMSALPSVEKTVVIALVADSTSTPVEQNASYAAISTALKMGFPIIGLGQEFAREAFVFEGGRAFISQMEAVMRLMKILVGASEEVVDLMERDLRLGVQLHCLSAIVAGTRRVYGTPTNAFTAIGYGLSIEAGDYELKTVYPLVFADGNERNEFLRGFAEVRRARYSNALGADCLFTPRPDAGSFDILSLYGLAEDVLLRVLIGGHNAVAKRIPGLKAGSIK
jgi:hypothetical protein